jgi:hypothetical protein
LWPWSCVDAQKPPSRALGVEQAQNDGPVSGIRLISPGRIGQDRHRRRAILEHDWGPLIASSVKTDLLASTIKRRSALDDIAIFDPLNSTAGLGNIGWSPLVQCRTAVGAQSIANNLIAAAPSAGTARDHNFWTEQAGRLAWALLYTAAIGQKTMRDVVIWAAAGPKIHCYKTSQPSPATIGQTHGGGKAKRLHTAGSHDREGEPRQGRGRR